jgi:hypothetical protein
MESQSVSKPMQAADCRVHGRWSLERVLFLLAGTVTGLSVALAAFVSPWFLLLTGFVAANQLLFVAIGNCPSSWLLRRYAHLKGAGER